MKSFCTFFFGIWLGVASAQAAPLVIGYERFHAKEASVEGGRLLYNELGCVNCHGGITGLPERRGPNLKGVTKRIQPDWIRSFLANPEATKSGTNMPHLLPRDDPEAASAVIHYLAELEADPTPKLKGATHVNSERGKELFHSVGCVACHAAGIDFQPVEGAPKLEEFTYPSQAFPDLSQKYPLSSLAAFLLNPLRVRPDGRMPHLNLEEQDALDLAGYLLRFEGSDGRNAAPVNSFTAEKTKGQLGEQWVRQARCAACHDLPQQVAATKVPLKKFEAGCLSGSLPPQGTPDFGLNEVQRASLFAFLKSGETGNSDAKFVQSTLEALNCLACHERGALGGPDNARKAYFQGDHNLGDTGKYPPPLTGIGRKLQPEWLEKVLAGQGRVRPYLQTRMPVYGTATKDLGAALSKLDAKKEPVLPGGDDTAGRKLLGTQGGLGCITCHRWAERPALGIQALDLSNLGQRIQPGWLVDYLIHPAGYRPSTLMPSFWPDGKSANLEILGGDLLHQIASIYSFAKSDNGEPEGFPATSGGEFELVPKDYPIVQRTFLDGVGTHAILVGFPQGFHLAYDGKSGRPILAWRGRFFDGYSTWFSRFAPFEKVLGDGIVHWSHLASDSIRFDGYRLDQKRVPIFLLTLAGMPITDRFEAERGGLRRTLTGEPAALGKFTIDHPEGVSVTEMPESDPKQKTFVYLWK